MRRYVIAGNWKMNFTPSQATAFINEIKPMVAGKDNCDIVTLDISLICTSAKITKVTAAISTSNTCDIVTSCDITFIMRIS